MTAMSLAADRPLNWNVLGVVAGEPDGHENQLRARGARRRSEAAASSR